MIAFIAFWQVAVMNEWNFMVMMALVDYERVSIPCIPGN
jgi:hypothetical protein